LGVNAWTNNSRSQIKGFIMFRNRFFILLICCSAVSFNVNAKNSKYLFEKANECYKNGKFEDAMQAYKKICSKTPMVNYNLGNCAYKLGQKGYALLYWRRAEKDWGFFGKGELLENISLLKDSLRKRSVKTAKRNIVIRLIHKCKIIASSFLRTVPLIVLQFIFLLLWLFLFLYLRFLYKKRKKILIVSLFTVIAGVGFLMVLRYGYSAKHCGVVVNSKSELLSGPSSFFQPIGYLSEADEVVFKKESGDFIKVKAKKMVGWIKKDFVKKIDE